MSARSTMRDDNRKETEMSQDTQSNEYHARLTSLWNEGSKEIALGFLKRATSYDMNLQELAHALQFVEVRDYITELSLDDILPQRSVPQPAQSDAHKPMRAVQKPVQKTRRKRRSSDEISALRDALMGRLQAAVGSVTTSHLRDVLSNGGHDVDLLQLGRMLAALEQEGYITCLGGKPKAWRLKPQGRRAPEPLVIRKAQDIAQKDGSAAV